jgi:hypothetical protein
VLDKPERAEREWAMMAVNLVRDSDGQKGIPTIEAHWRVKFYKSTAIMYDMTVLMLQRILSLAVICLLFCRTGLASEFESSSSAPSLSLKVAALTLNYRDYSPNGSYMLETSEDSVTWLRLKGPFTPADGVGDPFELLSTNIPKFRLRALGASGSAVVSKGSISRIFLLSGGGGYTEPPAVSIIGGGGSGAVVTAQISGGSVVGCTVVNGGTGYTFPTVVIAPPNVLPGRVETSIMLFNAVMKVEPNIRYQLEGTTNYADWSSFGTFQTTNSTHTLLVSAGFPLTILRLKQLP